MSKKIAAVILVFINSIFCLKYFERVTEYFILVTVLYALAQFLLLLIGYRFLKLQITRKIIYGFILVIPILVAITSLIFITPEDLNVDRWSVIDSFLTELFKGNYPYEARSHTGNPPGPMPFYFLMAIPFYFFKLYSFLSLLGFTLLVFFQKNLRNDGKFISYLLVVVLSISMLWEILSLSNIVTYSSIIAIALYYFDKLVLKQNSKIILVSMILGLLLSTRSVFALAYIVFFLSYLITKSFSIKDFFKHTSLVLIVFSLTFLPLVFLFPNEFSELNPFIIQSSFLLPQQYIPILFIIALLFGRYAKTSSQRFLFSGFTLFFSILVYACYIIYEYGMYSALFESNVDLSYFLFCVPFLLIGIRKESLIKVNR